MITSNRLAEEYFAILDAPHKELIWFEDSAHTPSWDAPAHFVDVMVNKVLAQAQTQPPDTDPFSGYFDTQIPAYLREHNIAGGQLFSMVKSLIWVAMALRILQTGRP